MNALLNETDVTPMASVHRAYGLNIRSDLALPELLSGSAENYDVAIRYGHVDKPPGMFGIDRQRMSEGETICICREGIGDFQISAGREILLDPVPDMDERRLRRHILDSLLPMLLHQRGHLILHGSAAAVNSRAIAFLGASGMGKSTLAAAFYAQGHPIVTDDIAPIRHGDVPTLCPGCPQLKLHAKTALALNIDFERLSPILDHPEKRTLNANRDFDRPALPLGSICILSDGPSIAIERLALGKAFAELMRHTYIWLDDRADSVLHLHRCAALAQRVPIYRVQRPRILKELPNLVRAIKKGAG